MMIPFELIDHTAEIGIRAYGRSREELFVHMAQGMTSLIVPCEQVRSSQKVKVRAHARGWDSLLVAWLKELLYLFDTRHFLGSVFEIRALTSDSIEAVVAGETLDPMRHSAGKEVKAVTYCDLVFSQTPEGTWMAQVIFDI